MSHNKFYESESESNRNKDSALLPGNGKDAEVNNINRFTQCVCVCVQKPAR